MDQQKWFANRGQVIQVVIGAIALVLAGIKAWPSFRGDQVLSMGTILFYVLILLTVLSVWRLVRNAIQASKPTEGKPPPKLAVTMDHIAHAPIVPVYPPAFVPKIEPGSIRIDQTFCATTITLSSGDYQDFNWDGTDVRIEVSEVVKGTFDAGYNGVESYAASINVKFGGALVFAGNCCKRIGVNMYQVPRMQTGMREEESAFYLYTIGQDYFRFFRGYVDHINPQSGRVTFNLFFARVLHFS
jgi:hypothetical protein